MPYIHEYTELTPQEKRQLFYKRWYKQDVPDWDDSMVLLTTLVRDRVKQGSTVLDYGCGRGNFVIDELRDRFSKTIGFDVAEESVVGNVSCDEVIIGTVDTLPFADASIDCVLSLWVFEHIEDPEAVMKEIHRVLKPGGFFAFVTPNRTSLLIALRRIISDGIAHRLLKWLYGREEKDVFRVYYRANTVHAVKRLADASSFLPEVVVTNADPSYTSFNALTLTLSKVFTTLFPSFANPHVLTVLRKAKR